MKDCFYIYFFKSKKYIVSESSKDKKPVFGILGNSEKNNYILLLVIIFPLDKERFVFFTIFYNIYKEYIDSDRILKLSKNAFLFLVNKILQIK